MKTIQSSAADAFVYYGDREGWLVACSQHRDSDALDRSNFAVISADLLALPDGDHADGLADVAIESASHFLVGWVEYLLVRPGSPAAERAAEWETKLADYPIANEDHHSQLEWNEEWCQRCDSAMREEHPTSRCAKFRGEGEREDILWRWQNRGAA